MANNFPRYAVFINDFKQQFNHIIIKEDERYYYTERGFIFKKDQLLRFTPSSLDYRNKNG